MDGAAPTGEATGLRDADFSFVAGLLYERLGIRLGEQKRSLVAGRLAKRVRSLGLRGYAEYFDMVRSDPGGPEEAFILDHLTTNHSYFYRERDHFDFLASEILLPAADAAADADIRIWSAGCASGEEPYGIAMTALDCMGVRASRVSILATDISAGALSEALRGAYPEGKLRDLPRRFVDSYMEKGPDGSFYPRQEVRRMVLFKRLNLVSGSFPFKGLFDAIFCRNVMIYFDAASRARLLASLYAVLRPGGYLFIGHSESIPRESRLFTYLRPAIYRKAP